MFLRFCIVSSPQCFFERAACAGGTDQQFTLEGLSVTIQSPPTYPIIRVWSNNTLCMEAVSGGNVFMAECTKSASQLFKYTAGTMALQPLHAAAGQDCVDYAFNADGVSNVGLSPCHGGISQQWYMTSENYIRTKYEIGRASCRER